MDQNYNFDLEGRRSDNNEFRESLRYIILRWLNPVLCKPSEDIAQSRESYERQIYSRMGHLRLLPETQHYSEEQVRHCLAYENKDLPSLNAQRKLMLSTERETTYVRPVMRNEDELPPINITIIDEQLFRSEETSKPLRPD